MQRLESWLDRIAAYILLIVIAGAPLPLGSRAPATVALWCVLLGLGLLLASTRRLRGGHVALLVGIGFVAACFGFLLHEQLSTTPWIASPNSIWSEASDVLGRKIPASVAVLRGEPFYAIGAPLACLLALTLGLIIGTDSRRADQALRVLAWSGVAYAVFGVVNLEFDLAKWFGTRRISQEGVLTSTFVNRNTAATYLGSCAIVWLVLFLSAFRQRLPPGPIVWSKLLRRITAESAGQKTWIIRFGLLIFCLAAMFLTSSRGGVLATLFAMTVVFVIFFRRDIPGAKGLIVLLVAAAGLGLALLQVIGGQVQTRIDVGGLAEAGRASVYRSSLQMILDHPWFGTGLGTFTSIFPAYRRDDISIWGVWPAAHSTPLELAVELGLPMFAVIALGWAVIVLVLIHGTRKSRIETLLPLSALGVTLVALVHSAVDFSLQVSGYAIVVFAIVGVGLAQSIHNASSSAQPQGHRSNMPRRIDSAD